MKPATRPQHAGRVEQGLGGRRALCPRESAAAAIIFIVPRLCLLPILGVTSIRSGDRGSGRGDSLGPAACPCSKPLSLPLWPRFASQS